MKSEDFIRLRLLLGTYVTAPFNLYYQHQTFDCWQLLHQ